MECRATRKSGKTLFFRLCGQTNRSGFESIRHCRDGGEKTTFSASVQVFPHGRLPGNQRRIAGVFWGFLQGIPVSQIVLVLTRFVIA